MERKLLATKREAAGKGGARKTRAAGRVPGVLYGHGMDPVAVDVDARELFHILHTDAGSNVLIDLRVGGDRHLTMPREIQRDHIRGQFLHVDFLAVRRDQKIAVDVPVELAGESHGVKEGGVIEHHLWEVRVECLPTDVPDRIEVDISHLKDVTILSEAEETIVSVVPPPILRVEEEEEAAEVAEAEAEGATAGEAEAEAPAEAGQGEEEQG